MSRSLAELLIGRRLADRYEIEEVIGRGGMSIVYRASDSRLGRAVALKVIAPPEHEHSREELRERFRREAASAARIPPHPNVVQVYDYGTDPELDLDFIVMELLSGRDLKEAMREARPRDGEAIRILLEAARGLAAGHGAGIVHRDVKPANIFLPGRGGAAKITDFGIAKALELEPADDLTRTGFLPHSPAYASPEQRAHARTLTPASDVYQLGLVAYELLAGARPFDEEDRQRLQRGEPVALPSRGEWQRVPQWLREVVRRALDPDPSARFPDGAALAEALAGGGGETVALITPADLPDDATLLAEESIPDPPLRRAEEPPFSSPAPVPAPKRPRALPGRAPQLIGGAVLALLGLLLISRLGDRAPAAAPTADATEAAEAAEAGALDVAALDEEFRPLLSQAHERLREGASDEQGEAAAAAVERVILDLNDAWVRGELDRHLSYYADRVDYYDADNASRRLVREDRTAAMERYPEREITLGRRAITFPEPGRARALVEKEWSFGGGQGRHEGAGRQEYELELEDGRWRIVAERMLEVYRAEQTDG